MMTGKQINLVRTSFEQIRCVSEEAAVLFYARLFELEPNLRELFNTDIREQGRKLMEMLELAVKSLDNPDAMIPPARALGARHAGYGVENRHYETVATALWWTFDKALDADFTAETQAAWAEVYNLLAETMKDAAGDGGNNGDSRLDKK